MIYFCIVILISPSHFSDFIILCSLTRDNLKCEIDRQFKSRRKENREIKLINVKQAVNKTIRQFVAESLTTSILAFSIFSLHWTAINEFNKIHVRLVCIFYRYISLSPTCFGPSWTMIVEKT